MRIRFSLLAMLSAFSLLGATCVPINPTDPVVTPGVPFGKTVNILRSSSVTYQDGLRVTLQRVNDSRCQPNVVCVWQGELAPELLLRGGELGSAERTLQLGTERTPQATVGNYQFLLKNATTAAIDLQVIKASITAPQAESAN